MTVKVLAWSQRSNILTYNVWLTACHKDIIFDIFSHKPEATFTVNSEIFVRFIIFVKSVRRHICNTKNSRVGHD